MPQSPKDHDRKKILFLITEDWFFLSHFLERAIAARDCGYEIVVAARDNGHAGVIKGHGFRFAELPFHRSGIGPLHEIKTIVEIARVYRREQPDIVHHIALKPIIYGSLVHGFAAVVNAPVGMGFVFTSTSLRARILRPLVEAALRLTLNRPRSRVVFENSDDLRDFCASGMVEEAKTRLIRGAGVDIDALRPTEEPKGRFRAVLIARMLREKGIGEFVEAARLLRGEGRDIQFALVGNPDPKNPNSLTESELLRWHEEGIVQWLGFRTDVAAILADSNLAVLPSYYREGLPKALLEAMASGRAVVATDVVGCREAVKDGYNGLLVPPRDAAALARAIARLADDPDLRKKLAEGGRLRAEREFSTQLVVEQTLLLYQQLMTEA